MKKTLSILLTVVMMLCLTAGVVFAEDQAAAPAAENTTGMKAITAALTIAVVAAAGAIAMGISIRKTVESISRQPEAGGQIQSAMMLGLVFIETAIIYALIIAILIIFVL